MNVGGETYFADCMPGLPRAPASLETEELATYLHAQLNLTIQEAKGEKVLQPDSLYFPSILEEGPNEVVPSHSLLIMGPAW